MNPHLIDVYEKTLELFHDDDRVLAAYMSGSAGTPREDKFSDVDPVLVIRDADFDAVDADLPGLFAAAGAQPILWWPERISGPALKNYAVFYETHGTLVQYDITFERLADGQTRDVLADRILFDKHGVLRGIEAASQLAYSPERLSWRIEMYWIYVYIHCKYLKRKDIFRLLAAQQELFEAHLEVLHALHPEIARDWWPIMASQLTDEISQSVLLRYRKHGDVASVAAALPAETVAFARDARAACEKWSVPYPQAFADRVLRYLRKTLDEVDLVDPVDEVDGLERHSPSIE